MNLRRSGDRLMQRAPVRRRLLAAAAAIGCTAFGGLASGVGPPGPSGPPVAGRRLPGPPGTAPPAPSPEDASASSASPAVPTGVPAVTVPPAPEGLAGAPPAPTAAPAPAPSARRSTPAPRPAPAGYPAPRPETNRSAPPSPGAPTPAPGAVTAGDFPDPTVIRVGAVYYAYSTQVGPMHVPVVSSTDLVHWQSLGDALAALPAWSSGVSVWAPSVAKSASGYVLFYSTRDNRTGDQCISRAESLLPQGPFVDTSADPFECQLGLGGSIDPDAFVDANGAQWLLWKSQGTAAGRPPQIWAQAVGGDWNLLEGLPVPILGVSQHWQGGVVEAPDMVRQGDDYLLFYSGNNWDTAAYGVGYAVCRSVIGPCSEPQPGPILSTHGTEAGPGSVSVFSDALGHLQMAYHAWTLPRVGYPGGQRSLHFGVLTIVGDRVAVSAP